VKLLLDTCTFLWLAADHCRLSEAVSAAVTSHENQTFLSTASAWEISIKYASGKLNLRQHPDRLIPKLREASNIYSLAIDEESALLAGRLAQFHSDPFDRVLVAQAVVHGMTILTPDRNIEQYAVRVLW